MTLESTRLQKEIRFALVTLTIVTTGVILISTNSQDVFALQYSNHTSNRYQINFNIQLIGNLRKKWVDLMKGQVLQFQK